MTTGVTQTTTDGTASAIIAGGCFWCLEADLRKLPGVISVVSGYAGGTTENPTYDTYASGAHREVVEVHYDSAQLDFRALVIYALKHIDPTDGDGSFADRGEAYAPALYYQTTAEREVIEAVLQEIAHLQIYKKPLAVDVLERPQFWPAEAYHQNYANGASASHYKLYRAASGRDSFITLHWGSDTGQCLPNTATSTTVDTPEEVPVSQYTKPSADELRQTLTPLQYKVTQEEGTEPPYQNEYNDTSEPGIYVDVVSGEPLFLSNHKFDSGTGWPSFTQPISPTAVLERTDKRLWQTRTEVRSAIAQSHLGHVFPDGPKEAGGLRYCMNSAALRFIPVQDMPQAGYEAYVPLIT